MTVVTIDIETYADIPHPLLAKLEARVVAENPLPDLETQLACVTPRVGLVNVGAIERNIAQQRERLREKHIEAKAALEAKKDHIFDKAALSPLTGRVVSIALGHCHRGTWEYHCWVARGLETEREVLGAVDMFIERVTPQALVTFNGRRFDVPFLIARMALHGVDTGWRWPTDKWDKRHVDLCDYYDGKQDLWAALLTGEGKATQGSSIAELVQSEDWEGVKNHNIEDVVLNALMYDRLTGVLRNLPKGDI